MSIEKGPSPEQSAEEQSFEVCRQRILELTEGVEPKNMATPNEYQQKTITPLEILELTGLRPEEYRLLPDDGFFLTRHDTSTYSDYKGYGKGEVYYTASFVRFDEKQKIWEIAAKDLTERWFFNDCHQEVVDKQKGPRRKILDDIHIPFEKQRELKEKIFDLKKQTYVDYRTKLFTWLNDLQQNPAYHCLFESDSDLALIKSSLGDPEQSPSFDGFNLNYNAFNVDLSFMGSLAKIREKLPLEWARAEKLLSLEKEGNILVNWGGDCRHIGNTSNIDYWVIQTDGSLKNPSKVQRQYMKSSVVEKKEWLLVDKDDMAITWMKGTTAAPHKFQIAKVPLSGCTEEQINRLKQIQLELNEEWAGKVGMSGKKSPPVGGGWLDALGYNEPIDDEVVDNDNRLKQLQNRFRT